MSKVIDISTEASRTYTFGNGTTFVINEPAELHVFTDENGTTHRVIDKAGVTHRPERGWVGISWKPHDGAPPFVA